MTTRRTVVVLLEGERANALLGEKGIAARKMRGGCDEKMLQRLSEDEPTTCTCYGGP